MIDRFISTKLSFEDMTVAESIHLKKQLIENPDPVHPLQYRERTGHILPLERSKVQSVLDDLHDYTEKHQMRLNQDKTMLSNMIFCQT